MMYSSVNKPEDNCSYRNDNHSTDQPDYCRRRAVVSLLWNILKEKTPSRETCF